MRHAVPVEDFLLLLCSNAIVLVQKVQEGTLRLFERCISTRFQVAQVRKYSLFEFLRVLDRSTKSLEPEGKTSHDIRSRDMKKIVPAFQSVRIVGFVRYPWSRRYGRSLTIEHKKHIPRSEGEICECIDPESSPRAQR